MIVLDPQMVDKKRGVFSPAKKQAIQRGILYPKLRYFAITEAKPLLKQIKAKKINDIERKSLTNYLIIRAVTIFEIFLLVKHID